MSDLLKIQIKQILHLFQDEYAQDKHRKIASNGFKLQIWYIWYTLDDKITAKDLANRKDNFVIIDVREKEEIADVLGVSQQTVSLDVIFLEQKAREETRILVEKKLPLAHLNALKGVSLCFAL